MNWDTIQQVLRILLYTIGGWLFGDAVAQGAEFQQAVGGVLAFGAFIWWFFWERKRPDRVIQALAAFCSSPRSCWASAG